MSMLQKKLSLLLSGGFFLVVSGVASAAVDKVICVPWQGDTAKQHTILSGQAAQLKCVVKTTDTSAVYAKWVFGDATESAVTTLSGKTKYNVETTHTYTAAAGTPFTAKLQISNTTPFAMSKEDPFLMKVEADNINARINIAIDKGLWYLYKAAYSNNPVYGSNYSSWVQTYDGTTAMGWVQTSYVGTLASPTASAVHAFGINGHKVTGDANQDPYVESVKFGLNYLVNGYRSSSGNSALRAVAIGPVTHGTFSDNPEAGQATPNGYGIEVYEGNDHQPYQGGQIMDAIIASGVTPGDLTGRDFAPSTPKSHNWTYGELLQDMADMHAWGQWDGAGCVTATPTNPGTCGSWWYNWNYSSPGDNSASQWPAIGMLPAEEAPWSVIVPPWVKTYNANWLAYSRCTSGSNYFFSYNAPCGCAGDSCLQTTTSAMVQMIFAGQDTTDFKWAPAQRYIADLWRNFTHAGSSWGNPKTYGWYSFAKAMRLAKPAPVTHLVKSSGDTFDWYYGDTGNTACTTEANCEKGLAPRIVELQASDGHWDGNLSDDPLTSAWMVITLRPTLFAAAPIACFTTAPNPAYAGLPVSFDPSCSGHSESGKGIGNLTKFEWDWNNDGVYDAFTPTPAVSTHAFACAVLPCAYPVTLRVTDDNSPALSATTVVTVNITEPPHPPVANAGGPYMVSLCAVDTLKLDGSASFDPNAGTHQTGCTTCPDDGITAYDWDLVAPLTFDAVNKAGVSPTLSNAEILSLFASAGSHDIALRVTDNTALAFPASGSPNLTHVDFGSVVVRDACMCNLAARAKSGKIQLTWTVVAGASSYDVYRSTAGPNSGFAKIATTGSTYATYLDGAVVNGTKYYYRVVANTGCGSKSVSAIPTSR